jgi:hypothetical protein
MESVTLFFIPVAPASRRLSGRHPAFLFRLISTLLSIFLLLSAPLPAKTKASASPGTDRDYISALAAANRFLHAWQTQDHETGLLMLSDTAKHLTSEDRLNAFFSPGLAAQQAFEIGRGKKLKAGRYAFPVALFEIRGDRKWTHPRFSQLIVIRTGNEDWAVDKLP